MTRHRPCFAQSIVVGLFSLLSLVAASGCDPALGVPAGNRPPTADARVLGMDGQNAVVDYKGAPVEITLDGTHSKDPEGPIKVYRWLSGTGKPGRGGTAGSAAAGRGGTAGSAAAGSSGSAGVAAADEDGGTASGDGNRVVPAGAPEDWPDDVAQPKVTLSEGEYAFVLWVKDEKGVVSQPSTLKVTVRTPLDPAVQACVTKVYPEISSSCKACVCGVNEMCQTTLTTATVCDATCWGLISCIATKCPGYAANPTDTSCLVAMCSDVLGGAAGARMAGPCVTPCAAQCRSM